MDSVSPLIVQLTTNREKIFRYAFILQFIAALPFLLFGYSTGKVHAHLILKGAITTGVIAGSVPVQFYSRSNSTVSVRTNYEAIVAFSLETRQFRFQEWKATNFEPRLGTPVSVIYDPSDPAIAMVDRGYSNYLPWAPCAVIGVFLALVALKGLLAVLFSQVRSPGAARA
ncbi:MAG TPA: DUF3592 domain-containing protein [Candidatus Acidoferrum sp.]|nr:DUF3592 domain-containing protein [Candidatus Acidoferrum sp.]